MTFTSSSIIIIIVIAFAFYLIYNQNSQNNKNLAQHNQSNQSNQSCPTCRSGQNTVNGGTNLNQQRDYNIDTRPRSPQATQSMQPIQAMQPIQPQVTNVVIDNENTDPYSDAIKRQDLYTMYDPLTYPQLRLPREVLEKYNDYYERNGTYPPFNQTTQPSLFDNPVLNGVLIKQCDENEPFNDNIPSSVPLFRVKSAKNTNRFFYYIIDQRYLSKIELKIPLDHVKINGVRYNNADYYGIPELFDGDSVEHIPIYPSAKFKVTLYKSFHFP